jgi:hypothetical protein
MLLIANPSDRGAAERRDQAMNALAMFAADEALRLANQRLDGYRQESANDRLAAGAPLRNPFRAIVSAVSSLRAALSAVDTDDSLPNLIDYPYRA